MRDAIDVAAMRDVIEDFSAPTLKSATFSNFVSNVGVGCSDRVDWTAHAGDIINAYHINDPAQVAWNAMNICSCDCNYHCTCYCDRCTCDAYRGCTCDSAGDFYGQESCPCNVNKVRPCTCDTFKATVKITWHNDSILAGPFEYPSGTRWSEIKNFITTNEMGWSLIYGSYDVEDAIPDNYEFTQNTDIYVIKQRTYYFHEHRTRVDADIFLSDLEYYADACDTILIYAWGVDGYFDLANGGPTKTFLGGPTDEKSRATARWDWDAPGYAFVNLQWLIDYTKRGSLRARGQKVSHVSYYVKRHSNPECGYVIPSTKPLDSHSQQDFRTAVTTKTREWNSSSWGNGYYDRMVSSNPIKYEYWRDNGHKDPDLLHSLRWGQ